MGDVITLKPEPAATKKEYCYTCLCGSQAFVLRVDARVECAHCEEIVPSLLWGQYFVSPSGIESGPLPESPPSPTST